jgi:hypothetical protein
MKTLLMLTLLALSGCGWPPDMIATAVIGTTAGSISAIGRTPVDALVGLVRGQDCSIVRMEQGKTYCKAVEPPPEPPAFCTRTLAEVNCWADPATLPDHPTGVADGPWQLTPAQEANRVRKWPW